LQLLDTARDSDRGGHDPIDPRAFGVGGAGAEIREQVGLRFQERARYAVRGYSRKLPRTAHRARFTLDTTMTPGDA